MTVSIVLLALVAAFLGLRLYSVLGKREGHEQEQVARRQMDDSQPKQVDMPEGSNAPTPAEEAISVDMSAESGLRAIINADRQFDPGQFVDGAKSAYNMVLTAFWKGDKDTLRSLCDDDVYESFAGAIDDRNTRGETLENRLVRIDEARIVDASFDHPVARVTMQFDADIAALVRDKDGDIIGGSLSDAVETHDVWTFMRDVKADGRNWMLDETDEA